MATSAGNAGSSWLGAATTTIGRATVPAIRTTRSSMSSAPNGSHALGRPIRDQVYSTRDNQATTLQALELTNGELEIEWREADGHVLMTGPTEVEFSGTLP